MPPNPLGLLLNHDNLAVLGCVTADRPEYETADGGAGEGALAA